ncbi:MAG: hypothetical protein KF684_09995 [Phycisphaeraceae bacterium]|nr:hypothetical protein [Phycisphaeraceae bacterium]
MQAGPISRHDLAVFATAPTSIPAREVVAAPAQIPSVSRRDYATFLAHENTKTSADRPTYSDLLDARNAARRDAARFARATPETPAAAEPRAIAPSPTRPRRVSDEFAPLPRPVAPPAQVRTETIANTWSLIDILL